MSLKKNLTIKRLAKNCPKIKICVQMWWIAFEFFFKKIMNFLKLGKLRRTFFFERMIFYKIFLKWNHWTFMMFGLYFNLYYSSYFICLLQNYIWYLFKIKLFKWFVINVWAITHINTIFLKLEYFNYNNVKPFKSKIFLT